MLLFDKLGQLFEEVWYIIRPSDLTNTIDFVLLLAMIFVAIVTRKKEGGFFKSFFKMTLDLFLLFILKSISPYLLGAVLILRIVLWLFRKHWKGFGLVVFIATAVATLIFILSNTLGV